MRCRPLRRITRALAILLICSPGAFPADSLPLIHANQNHTPAGVLHEGILSIQLEIAKGNWHPEAEDGMSVSVYAFGEAGQPLQNPGPLIRVPQGTEIHASLHNSLSVPVAVHGFEDPAAGDASVHVAPGAIEQVRFRATNPGLYLYWGATEVDELKLRHGVDSELTGAFVVDPPGADTNEEIFVLGMISEHAGLASRKTLATINGKSWPYTQRFQYQLGQPVRWRWINASNEPHALHLHGFYFHVDAFNRGGRIETYAGESRPLVVTQRIAQGETFDMSWAPDRPGRWLFHCHMLIHMTPPIIPDLPGLLVQPASSGSRPHAAMDDAMGMGQLVLGITVPENTKATAKIPWQADRRLQLEISERGEAPRYALQLRENGPGDATIKPGLIGPAIILTRGQPVEIEVLNKLKQPTAIHWHGIELESYYDGVPGWTGAATQTTPPIAPGASFFARMAPPRAGTFIYHTHWHDESQLTNGIYGPLIVLPPGEKLDPASDLTFVFSLGDFGVLQELALINGTPQSKVLRLQAGKKYRFRLINISTNNQAMQVSLGDPSGLVDWRVIAKDGADLAPAQTHSSKAQLTITVGETYDVEFSTPMPRELLLDLLLPGQKIHTSQTLLFLPEQGPAPN